MKKRRLRDFGDLIVEELKDPKFAAEYLNEHLSYNGPEARGLLLQALENVVKTQGASQLARRSGISRRALYQAFSKSGNPTLDTFLTLLHSVGISIQFSPLKRLKVA